MQILIGVLVVVFLGLVSVMDGMYLKTGLCKVRRWKDMLFNFMHKKTTGCLSIGLGFCVEWGYTNKYVNI